MKQKIDRLVLSRPMCCAIWAAAIIIAVILIYIIVCSSTGLVYRRFMKNTEEVAKIPGLSDGFIPQGVCYCDELNAWLICGYYDNEPSKIFVIDDDGKLQKTLSLKRENGDDYNGHAGGISSSGKHIWISNAKKVFHLLSDDIGAAVDGGTVEFDGYFGVSVRSSFTFANEEYLWVGEYSKGESYPTDPAGHMTTSDGSEHSALIFGYPLKADERFGVSPSEPTVVLSIRDIVQGFCVTDDGRYVLSTSSGLNDSHLYVYSVAEGAEPHRLFKYAGKEIPLYYLDSGCLTDTVDMPHMSEDLDFHDGKVCIAFEAGAKKYGGGLIPFSLSRILKYKLD